MYIYCYSIYLCNLLSSVWYVHRTADKKKLIKTATKYERELRRSSLNLGIIISSYLMKILKQHCLTIAITLRSSDQSLSNDQCRLITRVWLSVSCPTVSLFKDELKRYLIKINCLKMHGVDFKMHHTWIYHLQKVSPVARITRKEKSKQDQFWNYEFKIKRTHFNITYSMYLKILYPVFTFSIVTNFAPSEGIAWRSSYKASNVKFESILKIICLKFNVHHIQYIKYPISCPACFP